jgi:uncharacterized protein (TIGR02145 family)
MRLNFIPRPAGVAGFGRLINGYATTDAKNIAPAGWHVPSNTEWSTLFTTLSSAPAGKIKETGFTHWMSPNTGATNEVGFNCVAAGIRLDGYDFTRLRFECWLWSSTWISGSNQTIAILFNSDVISIGNLVYNSGGTLRCIKDNSTDPGTVTGNDGTVYPTVKIGDQVWMAENSQETMYRDGSTIPEVKDYATWIALTSGAWCYVNNDINNL